MRLFAPIRRYGRKAGRSAALLLAVSALAAPPAVAASQPDSVAAPPQADSAARSASADRSATVAVTAPTSFGQEATPVVDNSTLSSANDYSPPNENVLAYWTPERMAAAKSVDLPQQDEDSSGAQQSASQSQADGPEGRIEPVAPPAEAMAKVAEQPRGGTVGSPNETGQETPVSKDSAANASPVNGKLFYAIEGGYGECSASVVNTDSKRVVLTAAHCLYNPETGGWSRDVAFVPAYNGLADDQEPFGRWDARTLSISTSRQDDPSIDNDIGYVTLNNGGDNNQRIVDAVGAHGMTWNHPKDEQFGTSIVGYPSNYSDPDGQQVMWACWERARQDYWSEDITVSNCNFRESSSGGPWLEGYVNVTEVGYVRSLTSSYGKRSGDNKGPHFTSDILEAVNEVEQWD